MIHAIPISGKDSLMTAIIQTEKEPQHTYEYFFNDTEAELPDTYVWLNTVEKRLGLKITRIGKSLEDLIYETGMLPGIRSRFCTSRSKIHPMEDYFRNNAETTVYYGIRADEQERQGYTKLSNKYKIYPKYPLITYGITLKDVYDRLYTEDLLPPAFFWKELYDRVINDIPDKSIIEKLHPLLLRQLFAWRSRTNCYFCFFQRRYEWNGLLDHYPDLYEKACIIEEENGSKDYFWIQGIPLREYAKRRETVIEKRKKQIIDFITKNIALVDSDDPPDLLQITSCGLFCGK